jgi:hypothetical protein
MKAFALSISTALLLALPSCTVVHGDANKGTYTLATVGGDLNDMAQTSQGYTVASMDNSKSFKEASGAIKAYVWAGALKSVAGTAGKAWTKTTSAKEVTKRTGIKETGLTERTQIAADVEKAQIATPETFVP